MNRPPAEACVLVRDREGKPRLGFLGVGWIGKSRLDVIRDRDVGEITAVADPDPEAASRVLEAAPGAAVCRDLEQMLSLDPDGVFIATPSAFHAEQAMAVLRHGIPVFCQKPLAVNARETRRILDYARQADLLLGVDLSYRHLSCMEEIRKRVHGGDIGRVYAVELVFHNAYGPDKAWYYDPESAGGGCVMDLGIHLVDLMMWVLGFPEVRSVHSRLLSEGSVIPSPRARVEDYAAAQIDFDTGTTATLACSWNLPSGCDAVIRIAFYGRNGALALSNRDGSFFEFQAERFQGTSREIICEDDLESWWGRSAVEWVTRLKSDRTYNPELGRMARVADVLDALYANSVLSTSDIA
jgi:predicted dehydrogenase